VSREVARIRMCVCVCVNIYIYIYVAEDGFSVFFNLRICLQESPSSVHKRDVSSLFRKKLGYHESRHDVMCVQ